MRNDGALAATGSQGPEASAVEGVEHRARGARATLAPWSLLLTTFSIGVGEFVIMGLLPELVSDFGISIPVAGWLISGYALGVAFGGPLLAAATLAVPRKPLLLALATLFIIGTAACALAPNYAALLIARVIGAVAHGALVGVAAVVATRLVPPERAGSAVAMVIGGFTAATVVGVPLGTWIGQAFGWRSVFWIIATTSSIGGLGILAFLSGSAVREAGKPALGAEMCVLARGSVLLALTTTALGFGGLFAAYTYIAPFIQHVAGFAPSATAPLLFLFGVGAVIGTVLGGQAANRAVMRAMLAALALLAGVLTVLPLVGTSQIATAIVIFLMGAAAFGATPALQLRVVEAAREAPYLASTLNITAFNLGNAVGAYLGGLVVDSTLGLAATAWAGAVLTVAGLATAIYSIAAYKRANVS